MKYSTSPTREECQGRRVMFTDPSEDYERTPIYPLRFRLGTLISHNYPPHSVTGNLHQLEDKGALTSENYDRKFIDFRKKAIGKFAMRFDASFMEGALIEQLVVDTEREYFIDFVARV